MANSLGDVIKLVFFVVLVKPLVLLGLGLNIRGRENLPESGPAVIVANHNSHLDTLVLMSLMPLRQLLKVKPVAAADYFLQGNKFLKWIALNCIGIIPLDRSGGSDPEKLFEGCHDALNNDDILILFPEGSRGSPEKMGRLKKGIFHLLRGRRDVPVIPVRLYGLGKALPKGEALFVPFNCDVAIGEQRHCAETASQFIATLNEDFESLSAYLITRHGTLEE